MLSAFDYEEMGVSERGATSGVTHIYANLHIFFFGNFLKCCGRAELFHTKSNKNC